MNNLVLSYDPYQFAGKQHYAVSLTSGITYSDYERMRSFTHKASGIRRYETPLYALNDRILRELLLAFMETRLQIRDPTGTTTERRERIRQAALDRLPHLIATVDKLNREYVEAQSKHAPPERLKNLEMEIEMLDTQIRTTQEGGMGLVASIAYLYHRLKFDSVGVGLELGIKPPHVRSILWKLNEVFKSKFNEDGSLKPRVVKPRHFLFDVNRAAELRATGMSWEAIAKAVGRKRGRNISKAVRRAGLCVEKPPRKLIDAVRAAELRATGMPWHAVAKELGRSRLGVVEAIKRAGLLVKKPKPVRIPKPRRVANRPRRIYVRIDAVRAAELRTLGMGWTSIGNLLGGHPDSVRFAVKQLKRAGSQRGNPPTGPSLPDRVCPARPTASSMLCPPTEIERHA
jgi:hypothetical protein